MSGQATEGTPAPTPPTLNEDTLIPIRVDGVDQMKTLRELKNGYGFQSKMTQATQESAELRRELEKYRATWESLEADPARFVQKVIQTYDLDPGGSQGDSEVNPLAGEVAKLRAEIEQLAGSAVHQQQVSAQERQLQALAGQEGFDRDKVLAYATTKGVDNIEHAWLMMKGEQGAAAPAQTLPQPHQDALDAVIARKAASLGAVSPGASAAPGAQAEQKPGPAKTTAEAMARALEKHGTSMDGLMQSITGV